MATHRSSTSTKPPKMLCVPKNTKDHTTFIISCTANTPIATCTSFLFKPSLQIKNRDIPINTYNVLHIGPNAQFGGVQLGLGRYAYHPVISLRVNTVPTAPAKNTISIDIISLGISLILKLLII